MWKPSQETPKGNVKINPWSASYLLYSSPLVTAVWGPSMWVLVYGEFQCDLTERTQYSSAGLGQKQYSLQVWISLEVRGSFKWGGILLIYTSGGEIYKKWKQAFQTVCVSCAYVSSALGNAWHLNCYLWLDLFLILTLEKQLHHCSFRISTDTSQEITDRFPMMLCKFI